MLASLPIEELLVERLHPHKALLLGAKKRIAARPAYWVSMDLIAMLKIESSNVCPPSLAKASILAARFGQMIAVRFSTLQNDRGVIASSDQCLPWLARL